MTWHQDWQASAGMWQDQMRVEPSDSPESPVAGAHNVSGQQQHGDTPSSSEEGPEPVHDRPEGVESDDNFEVSDDADEQQVRMCYDEHSV